MGWIAAIILALLLASTRAELKWLRQHRAGRGRDAGVGAARDLGEAAEPPGTDNLIILHLELARRRDLGELDEAGYRELSQQIDAQWASALKKSGLSPNSSGWIDRCRSGWRLLANHGRVAPGPLPWERVTPQLALDLETESLESEIGTAGARPSVQPASAQPVSVTAHAPQPPEFPIEVPSEVKAQRPAVPAQTPVHAVSPARREQSAASYAWTPEEPTRLERALRAVSGWPRAALPFLVQNIGWLIGGFCFLAGSIFLVSYTTGFTKGLVVLAAVFAYTVLLIWAGYQLRLKRPELKAGSATLMTLGLLLVPLNLSAAVRLVLAGGDSWWLAGIGLAAALAALVVFGFAAQVISGVVDRALRGTYARLFLALAAAQLAVPLLARWPAWPLLAAAHLALLALLAYGLVRYAREWMRSIFVDQRSIAYFAGGSLLYAALISFVHLTWGTAPLAVPPGYYAPYLMAVCGLLFYLDTQIKEWAEHHAFLSRLSFLIYGLSVLAVLLALDAPGARIVTLAFGSTLYAMIAWRYLTLVPVYLLLASLCTLYGLLVLSHAAPQQYLLWSLPGLAGLWGLARWAARLAVQRSAAYPTALLSYRLFVLLWLALGAFTLAHATPGAQAMLTAVILTGGAWVALGAAPGPLLGRLAVERPPTVPLDLRNGPWLYAVTFSAALAVAYAPVWIGMGTGLGGVLQLAVSLVLLAYACASLALQSQIHGGAQAARIEVYANSALLCSIAGITLAGTVLPLGAVGFLALMLAAASGVLLWLALGLRVQWLFYAFMGLLAGAAVLFKQTYFPGPSTGAAVMLAGIAVWALLWRLDRQPREAGRLRLRRMHRPLTLLWLWTEQPADDDEPIPAISVVPGAEAPGDSLRDTHV